VIVVDDGSTDNGVAVVRSFDDPRIRLIQQENKGVSVARNHGIKDAHAELISFLDADDEWLPSFIETILRLRSLYPDAGIYGTAYETHFPGSVVPNVYHKEDGEQLLFSYFGAIVASGFDIFNSSSFAAPKDILIEVEGYPIDVKWHEDGTLFGKIALLHPVAYSPEICSIYHRYTSNSSIENTEYLENPLLQYLSTIPQEKFLKRGYAEDLNKYCDLCRLSSIARNIFSGHGVRARLELKFVKTPCYTRKKYKMIILSFIPLYFIKYIRRHITTVSYIKRKLI
jgi:glycosyltransferase involved in cell wall biosynthesis